MSLEDHIRDEIYGSREDKDDWEGYANALTSLTENTYLPHILAKRLIIVSVLEGLLIAFAWFRPSWLIKLLDSYIMLTPILAFLLGFLIAFYLYRAFEQMLPQRTPPPKSDIISIPGYSECTTSSAGYLIWFVSAAGALGNLVLLAFVIGL